MFKLRKKKTAAPPEAQAEPKTAQTANSDDSGQDIFIPKKVKFYKKRWFKNTVRIILLAALALGIAAFVRFKYNRQKQEDVPAQTTSEVTVGSVDVRVTGSGTVQPIESYTLSPLVEGTILRCDYDKGQNVEKGALLYSFEDTEAQAQIKEKENDLRAAQRALAAQDEEIAEAREYIETHRRENQKTVDDDQEKINELRERIAKLTVKAPVAGVVEGLTAQVGKQSGSSLGQIQNYDEVSATVSFNGSQVQSISEGDRVTVGIASLMDSVGGSVARKYSAPHSGGNGSVMYNVKIKLDPGVNIAAGTTVSVTVHTKNGDIECPTVGTVTYAEPQDIEAEEAGEVTAVYVESGDTVYAGQTIAVLKNDDLADQLEAAQETYQKDVETLNKGLKDDQKSYNDKVTARENCVEAVDLAQKSLESAQKNAENYTIYSPVSGVVLEKHYKAGDTFGRDNSDRTLMVVADMSAMVFTINVDELDISNIQEGQTVNVTADALPGELLTGVVTSVSKIGQAESGITGYPVEITVDDIGNLMSGMNVTAEINVGSVSDVLVAPASAIFMIGDMYYATVVTPGEAEGEEVETQVQVEVGLHSTDFYEIKSGLNEGDVLRDTGMGNDDGMMMWG